jgi:hypothetical protein
MSDSSRRGRWGQLGRIAAGLGLCMAVSLAAACGSSSPGSPARGVQGPRLGGDIALAECMRRQGFSVEVEGREGASEAWRAASARCAEEIEADDPGERAWRELDQSEQQNANREFNEVLYACLTESGFRKGDEWDYHDGGDEGAVVHAGGAEPAGFQAAWGLCVQEADGAMRRHLGDQK